MNLLKITAIANRVRNGVYFIKREPKVLQVADFSKAQIEKFQNDKVLTVEFIAEDENFDKGDDALTEEQMKTLVELLSNLPDDGKNKDGSPSVKFIRKKLDFDISNENIEVALTQIKSE